MSASPLIHLHPVKRLTAQNRLPHLLFYGPPGTGKTTTVLAIARQIYGTSMQSMVLELNASDDRRAGDGGEHVGVGKTPWAWGPHGQGTMQSILLELDAVGDSQVRPGGGPYE